VAGAAPFRNLPLRPTATEAERTGRAWYSTQLVRLTGHLARRSYTAILSLEDTLIFLVAAAPGGQQYRKHTDRLEGIDRPDEQRVYHLNSLSL
jgi:hypothetical protein